MNILRTLTTPVMLSIALTAAGDGKLNDHGNVFAGSAEPVMASFERGFSHQPTPTAQVHRQSIAEDLLYQQMNPIHWTSPQQSNHALAGTDTVLGDRGDLESQDRSDPIIASFVRELNHQSAPRHPIERNSVSADPLYGQLSAALWTDAAEMNPNLASTGTVYPVQ